MVLSVCDGDAVFLPCLATTMEKIKGPDVLLNAHHSEETNEASL